MNHEKYIKQCLVSLVNQTYPNIELLCVDNISSDKTAAIAEDVLMRSGVNYQLFRRERSYKITENLNFLVMKAKGKYLSILSGDDWYMLECIEEMIALYEKNQHYGLIYGNGWYFWNDKNQFELAKESKFISGWIYGDLLLSGIQFPTGAVIKKETFDTLGLYDETLAIEDVEYGLRVAKEREIGFCEKPLIFYRKHSAGMTGRANRYKHVDDYLAIIDKHKDHPNYKKAYRMYRKQKILGQYLSHNYKEAIPLTFKDFRFERFYFSVLVKYFFWARIKRLFQPSKPFST